MPTRIGIHDGVIIAVGEKIQAVGAFGVKVVDRIRANKSADLGVVKSCRKGIKLKRFAVVVSAIAEGILFADMRAVRDLRAVGRKDLVTAPRTLPEI